MNPIAKALIIAGVVLIVTGLFWQFGGKYFPLGRLPGDIAIKKGGSSFYFPIVSCLVVSVVLSLLGFIISLFKK